MSTPATLTVRDDLHQEELDGEVVVLDPRNGLLHVLAGTAAVAWSVLRDGGRTREALVDEVARLYDVQRDATAVADLVAFVDDLTTRALLVSRP